jgi:prepilin-type N-terminal cleavage/methylation domain-containing protein
MQDTRHRITPLCPPLTRGELKGGRESCTKGFVLLELIVVLFLISLIVGMAAVFFANTLPSHKFNSTVRNISTAIRQARALAGIHNETQTVTIDLDSNTYTLEGHASKEIPRGISVKVIDPMEGEIYRGKYNFVLYPAGNIEGGTIVLWTSTRSATIQMDPVVGTVVIK